MKGTASKLNSYTPRFDSLEKMKHPEKAHDSLAPV